MLHSMAACRFLAKLASGHNPFFRRTRKRRGNLQENQTQCDRIRGMKKKAAPPGREISSALGNASTLPVTLPHQQLYGASAVSMI